MIVFCCVGFRWRIVGLGRIFNIFGLVFFWFGCWLGDEVCFFGLFVYNVCIGVYFFSFGFKVLFFIILLLVILICVVDVYVIVWIILGEL